MPVMATVTVSGLDKSPPLRLSVKVPFTGPASLAFGVEAIIDTVAALSAIVTVALAVPMLYDAFG